MINPYRIVHVNHAGIELGEVNPEALEFGIYLTDIGYVTYNISLENPMATRQFTEADVTDYKLYVGDTQIQGGMHTDVEINDITQRFLSVSGKEWKHYLDTRFWDFNPADPGGNIYSVFDRDLFDIVRDILNAMMVDPNSLQITYQDPTLMSGITTNYQILPQDTETFLSKINSLGSQSPGFDFEINLAKQLILYTPRKGVINNSLIFELGKNLHTIRYGETGILGTKVLGLGAGTSSQVATLLENTGASAKYRRKDLAKDFGTVNTQTLMDALTAAELSRASIPITAFSCTYVPDEDFDFWNEVKVGDILEVRADLIYDQIDNFYRLVGIVSQPSDEGDEEISLTFDDPTLSL